MNTSLSNELQKLAVRINEATPCTEESYLYLRSLPKELHQKFTMGHSVRHISKGAGTLNAIFEEYEHSGNFDSKKLDEKIASIFFALLKLVQNSDSNFDTILAHVENYITFEKQQNGVK